MRAGFDSGSVSEPNVPGTPRPQIETLPPAPPATFNHGYACALTPRGWTIRTPLLVVVHVHDRGRLSNTSRLLSLAVRNATLVSHGVRTASPDLATNVTPIVLFPGHGAKPLTQELVSALPAPPTLVVPDGNWRQAGKMVKRLPLLAGAMKAALPTRAFDGPSPRRNRAGHRMSTYEAVTQALAVLEGDEPVGPLMEFYRRAVDRMLLVRGHLRLGDVYGGLDEPTK